MTEPTPNLPLLRKVLEHIDAHPEEWDQTLWGTNHAFVNEYGQVTYDLQRDATACHTACCIAGWAIMIDGTYKVGFPAGGMVVEDAMRDPGQVARELLGITRDEASILFNGGNSRKQVQLAAQLIASRAGEVL